MQYFLRSTISFSLLTAFLFSGLLQAQDQEIRIKVRKQDGDKVIEIDKTFTGDEATGFDVDQWLEEMGLDFETDVLNVDVDVETSDDEDHILIQEIEKETTIKIDNMDGEKKVVMIQSTDPNEINALMEQHAEDENTVIIISDGDDDFVGNTEEMQLQIMQRIKNLESELSNEEFEIVSEYFYDADDDKGTLGVMMQVDDNNQKPIVTDVIPGSAAEKAGLQVADLITAVGSAKVSSYQEVVDALSTMKKGDSVDISFVRPGQQGENIEMTKNVVLGGAQKRMRFHGAHPGAGVDKKMEWVESTKGSRVGGCCAPSKQATGSKDDTRGYLGVEIVDTPNGVAIDNIAAGSAASKSNMAEGMHIVSLDRTEVTSADQLIALLKDKLPGDKVKVKYTDDTGKTWKEKLRLQSRPAEFAQRGRRGRGSCAPADMAGCCPGQASKKCCKPEDVAECCPDLLLMYTPEEIAEFSPRQLKEIMEELGIERIDNSIADAPTKYIEIQKKQLDESTNVIIIEKDVTNNKDFAKVNVVISEITLEELERAEGAEDISEILYKDGVEYRELELDELTFYPNPSDGNIKLTFRGEENFYNIRVIDLRGAEVYSQNTPKVSSFQTDLDISSSPKGVYVLQIYSNDQVLNRKIIIE